MGGTASSLFDGDDSYGYHVLRVQDGSPGQKAGLEAIFDFIISIEGTRLEKDDDTVKQLLQSYQNKTVRLVVYSSKAQTCREVFITPNDTWGGPGLLGVSIRYCTFEGASENVWHVLSVEPKSPASQAGLIAESDYIVGSESGLNKHDDFYNLIDASDGRSLLLYVYNSESDSCRDVRITPNSNWGGNGLLGCDIGYGYLHRIPNGNFCPTSAINDLPVKSAEVVHGGCHTKADLPAVGTAIGTLIMPVSVSDSVPVHSPRSNVAVSPMSNPSGIPPAEAGAPPQVTAVAERLAPPAIAPAPASPPRMQTATGVPASGLPPPAPLPPGLFTPTFQPVHQPNHPPYLPMQGAGTGSYQPPSYVNSTPTAPPPSLHHSPFMMPPMFPGEHAQVHSHGFAQSLPQAYTGQTLTPKAEPTGGPVPSYPPATSATADIALPGMPPLDVTMPSLAELHLTEHSTS